VAITSADVGQRVSIRSATHAGEGEPSATDTLGMLRSWESGVLAVERRDGDVVRIAEADLLAAKTIPPPPAPRR
jgi:hypothetical protein